MAGVSVQHHQAGPSCPVRTVTWPTMAALTPVKPGGLVWVRSCGRPATIPIETATDTVLRRQEGSAVVIPAGTPTASNIR